MSHMQASIPRIGIHGTNGVRNGRRCCGRVLRNTRIAPHTSVNANNVPIFVRPAASPMETKPARPATDTPVMIVAWCGVPYFGWTADSHGHNSPSRDIA